MTDGQAEDLVTDYLARLRTAAAPLPPGRREELLEEIQAHLEAALAVAGSNSPAEVRGVLDRLGEPADIVAAARADLPAGPARPAGPDGWDGSAGSVPDLPAGGTAATGPTGREVLTVLLLVFGAFLGLLALLFDHDAGLAAVLLGLLGWVTGLGLLWSNPRWTFTDKLLGALVWPGGLAAPLVPTLFVSQTCQATFDDQGRQVAQDCSGFALPGWATVPALLVAFGGPLVMGGYLMRRAGRRAGRDGAAQSARRITLARIWPTTR